MKRKKMTFSLKMLWEGFRQCKMIGIFAAVIIVLGAVLAPVAHERQSVSHQGGL